MIESISAENLAELTLQIIEKEIISPEGGSTSYSRAKIKIQELITQAIKTATEPLDAKISELQAELSVGKATDRFSMKLDDLQKAKISELEAQNALLVEALEEISKKIGPYKSDPVAHLNSIVDYMGDTAQKALTNTAQAAEERDDRIKADGFNDCLRIYTEHMEQQGFSICSKFIENVVKESLTTQPTKKEVI